LKKYRRARPENKRAKFAPKSHYYIAEKKENQGQGEIFDSRAIKKIIFFCF